MREVGIGVIVPSVNRVIEPEFWLMKPPGARFHFTRARYRFGPDPAPLVGLAEDTVRAAELLADAGVEVITSGSTGGSFFGGPGFDRELIGRIEALTGIRATTPATAVGAALRALGAKTVSIATPYIDIDNQREVAFLSALGFEVVGIAGMQIPNGGDIAHVTLDEADRFARQHLDPSADACLVSCTNLRSAPLIAGWERHVGKPVITSNQATLWMALRMAGLDAPIAGFGRLLAEMPPLPAADRAATATASHLR
ncbi:MAG: hypothetical protein IT338_07695 [Thermomicrobiales bacterium]|nr:hypothetical protein [Thermomicrobiales bacterium]